MEKVWSKENFDRTMTTNVSGPVELVRALREQLKEGALVINVSSSEFEINAIQCTCEG